MQLIRTLLFLAGTVSASVVASDYRDDGNYDQGNYYGSYDDSMGDYFDKSAAPQQGGNNLVKLAGTSAVGWFLGGKIHAKRTVTKLKKKHSQERLTSIRRVYSKLVGICSAKSTPAACSWFGCVRKCGNTTCPNLLNCLITFRMC